MLTVQLQYIPEQNASFGCAVKTLNWFINRDKAYQLGQAERFKYLRNKIVSEIWKGKNLCDESHKEIKRHRYQ